MQKFGFIIGFIYAINLIWGFYLFFSEQIYIHPLNVLDTLLYESIFVISLLIIWTYIWRNKEAVHSQKFKKISLSLMGLFGIYFIIGMVRNLTTYFFPYYNRFLVGSHYEEPYYYMSIDKYNNFISNILASSSETPMPSKSMMATVSRANENVMDKNRNIYLRMR